jgi:hypothetical protein
MTCPLRIGISANDGSNHRQENRLYNHHFRICAIA